MDSQNDQGFSPNQPLLEGRSKLWILMVGDFVRTKDAVTATTSIGLEIGAPNCKSK